MADDKQLPIDRGAQVRDLLGRIRESRLLVYSENRDHLGTQADPLPFDPVRQGLQKHRSLFIALATPDDRLDDEAKRTILQNDIRVGFQPPNDWAGAAAALRERGGMNC